MENQNQPDTTLEQTADDSSDFQIATTDDEAAAIESGAERSDDDD